MTNKNDSNHQSYLTALQKMKEDDFSRKIIKPLFESMDFSRVDFVGGPFEEGKDLIAEYLAPLKGNQVYVIQSKKIGEGANTSEKTILSQLILQLQQCFLKKIKLHNGTSVLPSAVYLATPFKVGNRLLKEIHELLCLDGKVVEILDGPKILQLINEYNPNLIEGFLSVKDKLFITDVNSLNNLELISALNQSASVHDMNCYSDLAFFMGSIDSNILLDSKIIIKEEIFSLDKEKWDLFKKDVLLPLEKFLGFSSLTFDINHYDEKYEREYGVFQSEKNNKLRVNINQAQQLINGNENSVREVLERVNANRSNLRSLSINDVHTKLMDEFSYIIREFLDKKDKIDSHLVLQAFIENNGIKDLSKMYQKSIFPSMMNALKSVIKISQQNKELQELNKDYVNVPRVIFEFKTRSLQEWINKKCRNYKNEIVEINANNADVDLILFLSETQKILNVLEILLKKFEDSKKIIEVQKKNDYLCDGLSISPFSILKQIRILPYMEGLVLVKRQLFRCM